MKKTVKSAAPKPAKKKDSTPAKSAPPTTSSAPQQPDRLISAYTPFPHLNHKDIEAIQGDIKTVHISPQPLPRDIEMSKKQEKEREKALRGISQSKKAFIQAMVKSLGIVTKASVLCGISARTHYYWMEEDQVYAQEINRLKEMTLDFYEDALHQLIKDKHPAAVIFALKTQGKRRGYIESANHIPVTNDDNVQFYLPDNNRDKDITDATIVP